MTAWRTHAAIAGAVLLVIAAPWLQARLRSRRRRAEAPIAPDAPLETHLSEDGMLMAEVFQDTGSVLRVQVYVKQDDGPYGQPWIPAGTSFADREALHGVLRDALHGDYK
jgi:hypothetical protein